jgi:hypothetical protein
MILHVYPDFRGWIDRTGHVCADVYGIIDVYAMHLSWIDAVSLNAAIYRHSVR